ncbi:hypothetical protein ACM43_11625 [Bradyrhizobium sp. CCBAU 45321]|nr:hypothetical protein [Bradyrhizobium sp. CCBAU 45321]
MGVAKLQFAPRTAPLETDCPDVLAHALAKLGRCDQRPASDEELPKIVLPFLAWAALRRQDLPARAIRVVMKCCGEPMVERALGIHRLRQLKQRYGEVSAPFASA